MLRERGAYSRTDELGIDSLITVEMRSGFMKNLNFNISVLRILSGITVRDLLQYALQEIPQDFNPQAVENDADIGTALNPMTSISAVTSQLDILDANLPSSNAQLVDHGSKTSASCIRGRSAAAISITEDGSEEDAKRNPVRSFLQKQLAMSFSQPVF